MFLKPSSIPTNAIIAAILIGLVNSKLLLEAEIEIWPKTQKFSITRKVSDLGC